MIFGINAIGTANSGFKRLFSLKDELLIESYRVAHGTDTMIRSAEVQHNSAIPVCGFPGRNVALSLAAAGVLMPVGGCGATRSIPPP